MAARLVLGLAVIAAVATALPVAQEDVVDLGESADPVAAVAQATQRVWGKGHDGQPITSEHYHGKGGAGAGAGAGAAGAGAGAHGAHATKISANSAGAIAQATMDVWDGHAKAGWNKWASDGHGKTWHCKHCHSQCKTAACSKWCHFKFCSPKIKTGKRDMSKLTTTNRDNQLLKHRRKKTNALLMKTKKSIKMYVLRDASRALRKYQSTFKHDVRQYKRKMTRVDDLDKARYRSHTGRQRNRRKMRIMKHFARKNARKAQKIDIAASKKRTADYDSYVKGQKAYAKVQKMLSGDGVWNSAISSQAHVSTRFMKKHAFSGAKKAGVSSSRVAESLERSKVHLGKVIGGH